MNSRKVKRAKNKALTDYWDRLWRKDLLSKMTERFGKSKILRRSKHTKRKIQRGYLTTIRAREATRNDGDVVHIPWKS
jgi:hypothetical protein